MFFEAWKIIILGLATAAVGWIGNAVQNWLRTKNAKKVDEAEARIADVNADRAELDLYKDTIDILKEQKEFAWSEFDRIEKLLRRQKADSDKRFEDQKAESDREFKEIEAELQRVKTALSDAIAEKEYERNRAEWYRSLLHGLIKLVTRLCPNENIEPYKQEYEP